jgi:hypothetical protein
MRPCSEEVLAARAPAPAALALSPCGCVAYAVHTCERDTGSTLRAWDVRRGVCAWERALPALAGLPTGLAAAHDGSVLFLATDADADVAVLSAADGAPVCALAPASCDADTGITALALSCDGAVLCVARHSLRVDAYDVARLGSSSGTRRPAACASAAGSVPQGASVCALALAGTGGPSARTVFVAFAADCVIQLALRTGTAAAAPPLRVLHATDRVPGSGATQRSVLPLCSVVCVEPAAPGEPLLLYAGAPGGRLHVWRLHDSSSSNSSNGDDDAGSELCGAPSSARYSDGGACALIAGGVFRLRGDHAWLGSHRVSAGAGCCTALLAADTNEAFVSVAATPCGAALVLASAVPRGCVLRRFRVAPPAGFSRVSARIHAPALRDAFRAFLCCVFVRGSTPSAPHALHARLDAASRDAIVDAIFHALVRSHADDADDANLLPVGVAAFVFAVPLPRARDCSRGLIMFHHA